MRQFPTLDGIKDSRTREVLAEMYYFLENSILSIGLKPSQIKINQGSVNTEIGVAHGLNYVPSNILLTFVKWESTVGTISIVYGSTDKNYFYVQATQPCTATFLVGGRDGK